MATTARITEIKNKAERSHMTQGARDRTKWLTQMWENLRKCKSKGTGVDSLDAEILRVCGPWCG